MKRIRWACSSLCLAALLLLALCASAHAQPVRPRQADVDLQPGRRAAAARRPSGNRWTCPIPPATSTAWYRVEFDAPVPLTDALWAVYLPYLYGGGRLILNGSPLARIQEPSRRAGRPLGAPAPDPDPRRVAAAGNQSIADPYRSDARFAAAACRCWRSDPMSQLLPEYERRLFWVRTMSQFTVISCLIVGVLALFIWWRRREEALYGLFGAASLLWGIRTLTFVIEVMPATEWHAWRTIYHGATGGFVIVMLLFAMCLAGMRYPRLKWALLGYWLLGPLGYLASGGNELLISRYWAGGLLPIGFAVLVISATAAWRQRTPALILLSLALALAVLAGLHDYLIATRRRRHSRAGCRRWRRIASSCCTTPPTCCCWPWAAILSARLVGALQAIEQLNRTLEFRVAERESALAENYERLRPLEREHAAGEERQQIMRDLHDGLGSQLFLTLSRAEAGRIDQDEIVQALRECIADLRLTLEAMSPNSNDFLQAWGNFRFRWQQLLDAAGLASSWEIDTQDGDRVELTPARDAPTASHRAGSAHQCPETRRCSQGRDPPADRPAHHRHRGSRRRPWTGRCAGPRRPRPGQHARARLARRRPSRNCRPAPRRAGLGQLDATRCPCSLNAG